MRTVGAASGLRVVGAGLPRTGTQSLRVALERLLGGRCHHMSVVPGHPFDLGADWDVALAGGTPDWSDVLDGYVAAVDWPASSFWRELSGAHPDALVVLSVRDSPATWRQSAEATILPVARMALAPGWTQGRGLVKLFERFAGGERWDDPSLLETAYQRHNEDVRRGTPRGRLLEWRATEGWPPLCRALGIPVPDAPFPYLNRRSEWG